MKGLKQEASTIHKKVSDMVNVSLPLHYNLKRNLLTHFQSTELLKLDMEIVKKFRRSDGPFFCTLQISLNELDVSKQAYQGGTFIGNHAHKLLKVV